MSAAKTILLALHIISAGLLISQFFVEIFMARFARQSSGRPGAQLLGMASANVLSLMGQIGGAGLIITGLGLLGVDGYALFGINGFTPTWLLIKQVITVIILVVVGGVITRGMRAARAAFAAGNTVDVPSSVMMASRLVNALVLVNIVLAVWKPM